MFINLKHLNNHSSILNRNPTYFFINYFFNFKRFKVSFTCPKQKSYILVFINYFYKFKTFKLSFKYLKQKY
jgi:hypothetical protein